MGLLALFHPSYVPNYRTPAPYELEIVRWLGLVLIGLAWIRPWALRTGGDAAARMRRWTGLAGLSTALYVLTANPLFLVIAFASVVAATLDAMVERSTAAANAMLARLSNEAGDRSRRHG